MNHSPLRIGLTLLGIPLIVGCGTHANVPPAQPFSAVLQAILEHNIRHVVIIVQENRTFDNLFNGFPGADTVTSGNSYGQVIPLHPVPLEEKHDLDHTHPVGGQTGMAERMTASIIVALLPLLIWPMRMCRAAKSSRTGR